jgi:hypothetical protein
MTIEELKDNILDASKAIINVARDRCANIFSDNIVFVIRGFNGVGLNFFEQQKLRKKIYEKAEKLSIDKVAFDLYNDLINIAWIDLIIYKAEISQTIIEIHIIKKSINKTETEKMETNVSFHSGFPIPPYAADSNDKFDINWQQYGFQHRWRFFWWKLKTKRQIDKIKNK